uniref:AB hydrolase-1 domain-containing protein n=2 Tax=Aegilops tauschii subsp. strangulata TaxID=200361 RepID=A0A453S367_AEGTS
GQRVRVHAAQGAPGRGRGVAQQAHGEHAPAARRGGQAHAGGGGAPAPPGARHGHPPAPRRRRLHVAPHRRRRRLHVPPNRPRLHQLPAPRQPPGLRHQCQGRWVQIVLENLETKKVVLVHGEGFGAWCWYKTISLLEEAGLDPVALDLTGSGIDHTDTNSITTLEEYSKPLIDYLSKLPENEKVVLVGHSCGGASVSYALEHCPKKISKAVFLTATMVKDSQRPFDVFSEELASADVFLQESQYLLYGNGKDKPPTGLRFDKQQIKGLYFNQSPSKDIALATVSMRPIPLAPIMEKLSLTAENYGSIRRYFIQTLDDRMLSPDVQEKLVRESPPDGIFKIKGGDHCPFFSKPQSLHKILLEILQIQAPAALFPGKAETLEEEEESAEKS